MAHICLDGEIIPADTPALRVDNKSYRYGDGLFETMKVHDHALLLGTLHFDRFFSGLDLLGYTLPPSLTRERLTAEILGLCEKNEASNLGRVRLSGFRGNGGVYEGTDEMHYVIESWPAAPSVNTLNENGLVIGVYEGARKGCDAFSGLKSANYLPYVMAARHALAQRWNDCLVLNTHGRIADASIANVFVISKGRILTPPLSEGGVDGVMRRHLLNSLTMEEVPLTVAEIEAADEIFLTNAMHGIKWVGALSGKRYRNEQTTHIYQEHVRTIWS